MDPGLLAQGLQRSAKGWIGVARSELRATGVARWLVAEQRSV
jgi:hypothetical protein